METKLLFAKRSFARLAILLLALAACRGHAQLSPESARQQLIQAGVEFNKDSFLASARKGDLQRVRLFLRAGMNPDETDEKGRTALMESASFNEVSTIQSLSCVPVSCFYHRRRARRPRTRPLTSRLTARDYCFPDARIVFSKQCGVRHLLTFSPSSSALFQALTTPFP
jgi:hypothetical protein